MNEEHRYLQPSALQKIEVNIRNHKTAEGQVWEYYNNQKVKLKVD